VLLGVAILLAGVAFALPASVVGHFLPQQVHAEDWSGTAMHGAAGKFSVDGRDAGAIEWQLHPLALLRGLVVMDVHWVKVGIVIDATTEIDRRGMTLHDIRGGGPIESLTDFGLAAGWRGNATVSIEELKTDFAKPLSAVGKIEVANISSASIAAGANLGSYVLQLPAGAVAADGSISANLKDTGGPIEVEAEIRISPTARTGFFSGALKERPEAPAALRAEIQNVAQLRPRDAHGRFPAELEFTF
jgi:Type II secretion system (T2SS), protein N